MHLFVNGTLMRGLELHANLAGATLVAETRTAPEYRLFSVGDVHPGMFRDPGNGVAVEGELYDVSAELLAEIEGREPPGLYIGDVELEDGRWTRGVLYPRELAEGVHREITEHAGWRAYMASRTAT
jgi:AGZA family xanthine/uracil permease-like MFS transporter